ncbi:MAG TPA: FimV/HubP family polar landmark protein [Methylotenera sp.]|nr:FimV/HubP family polar landmark protein [Methylotenera sp.]
MLNSKLKRITVALCMALVPISVFAAGLGKLNVMSGLGEPLKADIELLSVTPEELSSITAAIASEEAYTIQGIEKPASHNTIKVDVTKNAAGTPILKLQSSQPISEPFLDMLIQVDWSSGRLLREYTVLLDPPGYTGEADPNAQSPQTAQVPLVKSFSKNKKEELGAATNAKAGSSASNNSAKSSKSIMPAQEADTPVLEEDYMTQRGDTLANIARDMKPDGVSLEQMLVGLYQTNPNAFQGDNINRLKVGQILRQPSQDTLNSISQSQASREVKVQTANWNAYRNKLAGMVADSAPADSEASTQSAGGKITSAEDKSEATTTGPKDVVKLSAGDAAASKVNGEDIKSLQAKITALQEEATAREKSVKEAQDRTADLEKQIADMQKLLAMKNDAMADIQKQAATETSKPAEVVAPPVETAKPAEEVKPAEPAKPETSAPAENKPKPVITPAEIAAAEEPGFFASIMDNLNLNLLVPLGGLLVLLFGGWLYLRKKREKNLADFEQGIMTSGGLKANTVFGNTASASVDTGDTSFLTDFSQSASGGMIDTNDVDPIAEAEVYMAYGRDAQAEEILKDAISKEPKRHELHLKLLEMYAASKNLSAFETIAGELYTSLGAEDPMWAKVAEIGIKLEPNNPLYQATSVPTGVSNNLDASDFTDTPLAAEKDLDFSYDKESLAQDSAEDTLATTPKTEEAAFELPQFDEDNSAAQQPAESPKAKAESDALDFDMGDFGEFSSKPAEDAVDKGNVATFSNTMPALDMPTNFEAPKFMHDAFAEPADMSADNMLDVSDTVADTAENQSAYEGLEAGTINFPEQESPVTEDTPDNEAVLDLSDMQAEIDTAEFNSSTDFNFDIQTISPEAVNYSDDGSTEPNTFDLTTIDLELNDGTGTLNVEKAELSGQDELNNVSGDEPIEVETKLDLVAAYIEMDDKEGAKELLEEVLKEGGVAQRKRAEMLLSQIA